MKLDPRDFDEFGNWTGTCPKCGTDHHGDAPDTFAGEVACLNVLAARVGHEAMVVVRDATERIRGINTAALKPSLLLGGHRGSFHWATG